MLQNNNNKLNLYSAFFKLRAGE